MVTLQEIQTLVDENFVGRGKQKNRYEYTVKVKCENPLEDGEILRKVPRASLTSYRIRDSKIMSDILLYRTQYKILVNQLDICLSPANFVGILLKEIKIPEESEIGADGDFFVEDDNKL